MYATKLFANIDALKESGEALPKALFLSPVPQDVLERHEKRLGIKLQPDEKPLLAVNKKIIGTVGGYGWTGITIAILAGNNPWFVPFASFFMAYLTKGCELMATYGPDSYIGRVAAVMLGSSETTFYTIAVYFGSVGIVKTRYTIPASLCADAVMFLTSAAAVRVLMG